MIIKKVTNGCVVQTFDHTGAFLGQEFVAGDDKCEYESVDGEYLDERDIEYQECGCEAVPFDTLTRPFDMVQKFDTPEEPDDEFKIVQCVKCGDDCEAWDDREIITGFKWGNKEIKPGFLCENCDCQLSRVDNGLESEYFDSEEGETVKCGKCMAECIAQKDRKTNTYGFLCEDCDTKLRNQLCIEDFELEYTIDD